MLDVDLQAYGKNRGKSYRMELIVESDAWRQLIR
jgi:hypothetical protein